MAVKHKGAIVVDKEKCKGCQICYSACPKDVIRYADDVNSKGFHYAYMEHPDQCIGCASCALVCPDGVISVYKIKKEE